MKHKLLILATSMMFSLGASAQWTQPKVSADKFIPFAQALNVVDPEGGETEEIQVQLYNVDLGVFLTAGNYWGTRASGISNGGSGNQNNFGTFDTLKSGSATIGGNLWAIYQSEITTEDGTPCYYFANRTGSKNLACDNWDGIWVDGDGSRPWNAWKITENNDHTIKIEYDDEARAGSFGFSEYVWGAAGNSCTFMIDPARTYEATMDDEPVETPVFSGQAYTKWAIVSNETFEEVKEQLNVYYKALGLGDQIAQAKADHPGINIASAEAVYANTASTAEEIDAAVASIKAAIVDLQKQDATAQNPANFTSSIINPTFDVIGDFHGWLGTAFGAGGTTSTNAEHYGKTFDTYQELSGLPGGVYMVACNGYTRYQNAQADYNAWKAGTPAETKIYLKSETNGTFSTPVKHVSAGGSLDAPVGGSETTVTFEDEDGVTHTLYCPNTMESANYYFHGENNGYRNEAYGALADGDVLRIGLINQKATGTDWSIFDDFELYYFGDGEDAYQLWGSKVAENNALDFNTYYGQPEKKIYDDAIAKLQSASSKDEVMQAIADFESVPDTIAASINAYAQYVKAVKETEEFINGSNLAGDDFDKLCAYIFTDEDGNEDETEVWGFPNGVVEHILGCSYQEFDGEGYEGGLLSAKDILAEIDYLSELKSIAINNSMQPGDDVSDLLKNPKFDGNFDGWTYAEGKLGNHNVECFGQVVDIYQIVNAPAGVYALTCNAFERPADNGKYDGTEESKVFLFMNEFQTPVQNIVKDAISDADAVDKENCLIGDGSMAWPNDYNVDGAGWVPNSVDGAYYAFNANRYTQTVYGLVGDDGVMKVGLTSNGVQCHWVLWANFKLTYMGKDVNALSSILDNYIEQANAIENAGAPDMEALSAVVDKCVEAQANQNADLMYSGLYELIDAIDAAKESVTAYEKAENAIQNLYGAIDMYVETASKEAMDEAQSVLNQYEQGVSGKSYSGKELADIISAIETATTKLKIPDTKDATAVDPVDMTSVIENADFEAGNITPWIITTNPATNNRYEGATYENDIQSGKGSEFIGTRISNFINTWRSGNAALGDGEISQVIKALPAGAYKLTANMVSSQQSDNSIEVVGVYLMAAEQTNAAGVKAIKAKTVSENIALTDPVYTLNGKPEPRELTFVKESADSDLKIGILVQGTNANWIAADDFKLQYLGDPNQPEVQEAITAIDEINSSSDLKNAVIYNVAGQRMNVLQKGINIVNGKKVYVK